MAFIQSKGLKGNPNVDLTPLVDLGFLLITFFIFTTTMSRPKAMEILMPYQSETLISNPTEIKSSVAMTIILDKDNQLYYYFGIPNLDHQKPKLEKADLQNGSIRTIIENKKLQIQEMINSGALAVDDYFTILIKPSPNATTDGLIAIVDEMNINKVPVYAIVDFTDFDKNLIQGL